MRSIVSRLRSNYMIRTLAGLKGNPRYCIWLEPLWGIPYNLYLPYVTLFMTRLGMTPADIGLITSVTLGSQMISAILSGVLADKLGRRWCTVIFDCLSWSVPELLWACSQNMTWFLVAALFNGMWRITENSWGLLLVEDADPKTVMPMFSLTHLMGLVAAFFAPLSKLAVDAFGVTLTMRMLYALAGISMTAKFLILFFFSKETAIGKRRMEATRNKSIFKVVWECKDVYLSIIREKRMVLTLAIIATYTLITTLNGNYWALYITTKLGVTEGNVSLYTTFKSLVLLACILTVVPAVARVKMKRPMLLSLGGFAVSQALLLALPERSASVPLLLLSIALEGVALAVLNPLTSSLLFINADPEERARIYGMVYATITLIVAVFPMAVGRLALFSLRIPFWVNLGLFGVLGVMTWKICGLPEPAQPGEEITEEKE